MKPARRWTFSAIHAAKKTSAISQIANGGVLIARAAMRMVCSAEPL
jgi:hypothetical protein